MKLIEIIKQFSLTASDVGIPKVEASDDTLNNILNVAYTWAGIIAVIVIVVAGIMYATSGGDAAKTKKAKDAILYAVIGLAVIILAFTITNFITGRF